MASNPWSFSSNWFQIQSIWKVFIYEKSQFWFYEIQKLQCQLLYAGEICQIIWRQDSFVYRPKPNLPFIQQTPFEPLSCARPPHRMSGPQSWHRPSSRGVYDPERATLGRTAPSLGSYCLTLASLSLQSIDFYFTALSKAGLINRLSV